jgi:NitT/TauT family transport system permease protein
MSRRESTPEIRRSSIWSDLLVISFFAALLLGALNVEAEWRAPLKTSAPIDLSPSVLPLYALYSLTRSWLAYGLSLIFTILIASWAFYDLRARRLILPALDVLQSIPVLGFLPGLVLALVGVFPHSNIGLEIACIVMIFTGQVWNMAFSYYDSLQGVPAEHRNLARLYDFSGWQRFWRVELPFGTQSLVYNSMVSMAGGWFFLSITEAFQLGDQDFRLPGIGSYMSVAIAQGNVSAQIYGVIAMGIIIISVDRLVWWPLVRWSKKFNLDDFAGSANSDSGSGRLGLWMARSATLRQLGLAWEKTTDALLRRRHPPHSNETQASSSQPRPALGRWLANLAFAALLGLGGYAVVRLGLLIAKLNFLDWCEIAAGTGYTTLRVFAALAFSVLWAVPVGVWLGLNPVYSRRLQPFIQFAASFPAPMIYPWILALVGMIGGTLGWGAIPLIVLGTQWYVLFNVVSAASSIPHDVRSCAAIMGLSGVRRWTRYLLPAIAPGLVTGCITAAGGAWNATIVAEYVRSGTSLVQTTGLGAYISRATNAGDYPQLAAGVVVMAVLVVLINRLVWKKLQSIANDRCRFS